MIALITGASSGIGLSTAKIFAQHGYHLILNARRQDRLDALKKELENNHAVSVHIACFDVRNYKACETAIKNLPEPFKKIDVLINNAGLAAGLAPIQNGSLEHWEKMIDTNLKGLLYMTKLVSNLMIKNGNGHIINVGSIAGKEVYANGNVYCATKHAVDALNRAMRIDLLTHGIKVGSVSPGMVETEFSLVRFDGDAEKAKQVYKGMRPLTAEDIAETIFWMVSRPKHVNINDVVIMSADQASASQVKRSTE